MFQPGDKICCTKNGLVKLEEADGMKDASWANGTQQEPDNENENEWSSTRLCNGEIFFILEVSLVDSISAEAASCSSC